MIRVIDPRIDRHEVRNNLRGAGLRSPFMAALPDPQTISCLHIDFGTPGCKEQILEFVNT